MTRIETEPHSPTVPPMPEHPSADGELPMASDARAERADRTKTTIVIADDHTVVRQGLRMLIDHEQAMQVVAEAGTVPEAERLTRAHRPTVLVLDLNMPGGSGLEAIPRLRVTTPETAIVVLTMQDDPAFARQALQAGALGFVLKEAADEELLEAIRLAANGDTYLNPRLGARMAAGPSEPEGPPDDLSDREVEVLRLIALGHTNSEVAQKLFLSTRTVETHRAHIQQKINRTSRAELVRYALEHHLVAL
jgi:two-component system response regulator NreC